jgi:hypothetical protein
MSQVAEAFDHPMVRRAVSLPSLQHRAGVPAGALGVSRRPAPRVADGHHHGRCLLLTISFRGAGDLLRQDPTDGVRSLEAPLPPLRRGIGSG